MKRASQPRRRSQAKAVTSIRWYVLAIVLAGALAYGNSLSAPFVFDDRGTILDNPSIETLWDRRVFSAPRETPVAGRPVVNISFAINYALGGRDVRGYHIGNVAIHGLCALLVFGILRRTFQPRGVPLACGVALIWTVHPLNSEVVNYISQRTESLMALFYLLTLYASIRAMQRRRGRRWEAVAVLACALGMACKESMVTAPLIVLVYDRVFLFASLKQAFRARWRLYAGLAATWLVLAVVTRSAPRGLSAGFSAHDAAPWTYLLNQTVMVTRYLELALWPRGLTIYYGWPVPLAFGDVWPYALYVGGLLILTAVTLFLRPRLGFLGLWFFATLAPTSSIVPIATEVGAERRMYLPLIAVVVLAAILAASLWDRMKRLVPSAAALSVAGPSAVIAICIALMIATMMRNQEYSSSLRLAETTLERWPTPAAHSMLGTELAAAGRFEEAEKHLRVAAPDFSPARYYLGTVLVRVGKPAEAVGLFQAFIDHQPPDLDQVHLARAQLADLLMKDQRWAAASDQYRRMVAARPADIEARMLLATSLVRQQFYDEAIEHYKAVLAGDPTNVQALGGLGIALVSSGRTDEAIAAFRRAVEIEPGNPHAQQNLARALQLAKSSGKE